MYTNHAVSRSQQRSIPLRIVDLILEYGEIGYHKGADVYYMTQKTRNRISWELGKEYYRAVDKKLDCYVVVSKDGSVLTVARRNSKLKFKRNVRRP